jgi:hypothetical protein
MPRRNRLTPEGEIIADPARGLFMGNRGILHDGEGRIIPRFRHRNWVCCVTAFKGRRRDLMAPGRYTELFFLDEAVALAAGHRPCGECRREAYARYRAAWATATGAGLPAPREIDRALHAARIAPRRGTKVTFAAPVESLPDFAFLRTDDGLAMILGDRLLPWAPGAYGSPLPRPASGLVEVLTPRPTVEALRAGYRPVLHPSAGA